MLLIPALGRPRQADLCEFKASLFYKPPKDRLQKATEKPSKKERKKLYCLPDLSLDGGQHFFSLNHMYQEDTWGPIKHQTLQIIYIV